MNSEGFNFSELYSKIPEWSTALEEIEVSGTSVTKTIEVIQSEEVTSGFSYSVRASLTVESSFGTGYTVTRGGHCGRKLRKFRGNYYRKRDH